MHIKLIGTRFTVWEDAPQQYTLVPIAKTARGCSALETCRVWLEGMQRRGAALCCHGLTCM